MSEIALACGDLDAAIAFYTDAFGFRLDMIKPADAPRVALMSGDGVVLRLEAEGGAPDVGRAGMIYRDLIPGRLDGRVIASHIRIPGGGPVPDYVHYHRVRFQMIYCRRGWVRVVYEDQGAPFVMHEGDCVLQPPGIRHRVLEASTGLEVIEVSAPAEHETYRDHALELPTSVVRRERLFEGQRFVRHVAAEAEWRRDGEVRFEFRDTGIAEATQGLASVRVLRLMSPVESVNAGAFLFYYVLSGRLTLRGASPGVQTVEAGEACVVPAGAYGLQIAVPCEVVEVALAAW
jgi:quercetin dioxygenase-like cupin family protein